MCNLFGKYIFNRNKKVEVAKREERKRRRNCKKGERKTNKRQKDQKKGAKFIYLFALCYVEI